MLIQDYSDLGQTTMARRGAGNMFGPGHFSVTSFPRTEGGEEMFGDLGEEGLFGDESMFGLGQDEGEKAASKMLINIRTARTIRGLGNFVAAAGGSILAVASMGNGRSDTANIALGALGAGLGIMALISLGSVFKLVDLG